jgi:uncharacterized repeat protein (TIGR03803 family)
MTVIKHKSRSTVANMLTMALLLSVSLLAEALPTFTILHKFAGVAGGEFPHGMLAQGRDGNLYGTTNAFSVFGIAFKLSPAGAYTPLHTFSGIPTTTPSTLMLGLDGNFYGSTAGGNPVGKIFKMTPAGVVTELHTFGSIPNDGFSVDSATNEIHPTAPVQTTDGILYGTTNRGGTNGAGIIYKLTSTGVYTILHHFKNSQTDGSIPLAPMIVGKDGNLYGTTNGGGITGTVFRITPAGAFKLLHRFDGINDHGGLPSAPLVQGIDGNFYGTTKGAGNFVTQGNIFKITPAGAYTNLHTFSSANAFAGGTLPTAGLVQASDGNFYGLTSAGGKPQGTPAGNAGVLFKITPQGVYTVIHTFDGLTEGIEPFQSLVQHTNGKLYGALTFGGGGHGSIFSLDVGAKPFVLAQPNAGKAGGTVGLFGDFTRATSTTFNGVNASTSGALSTFRIATVPAGPATGLIKINKAVNPISSFKPFFVVPTFTSFSPASGKVGAVMLLKGKSLSQTTAVTFGGNKKALFTVDNDSQLTVNVPIGAVTGKISITTKGGSATSSANFTVKP